MLQHILSDLSAQLNLIWKHSKNTENGPFGPCEEFGTFSLNFFENSCNSAAEDNFVDPRKILRNLQNKDILLADKHGCHWKMVNKGFICYVWLLARRIRAMHTNVDSDCTATYKFEWSNTVHDSWAKRKDIACSFFLIDIYYSLYYLILT